MSCCKGHCCAAFPISGSRDALTSTAVEDGDLLGFMLRPLSIEEAAERRSRFGSSLPVDDDRSYFRCAYWDEESRLCSIYEHRPSMCRDYPGYGREVACEHRCGLVGGVEFTEAPLLWAGLD